MKQCEIELGLEVQRHVVKQDKIDKFGDKRRSTTKENIDRNGSIR